MKWSAKRLRDVCLLKASRRRKGPRRTKPRRSRGPHHQGWLRSAVQRDRRKTQGEGTTEGRRLTRVKHDLAGERGQEPFNPGYGQNCDERGVGGTLARRRRAWEAERVDTLPRRGGRLSVKNDERARALRSRPWDAERAETLPRHGSRLSKEVEERARALPREPRLAERVKTLP